MKILVTGAGGFIGFSLMQKFRNLDYEVVGWDQNDYLRKDIDIVNILNYTDVITELEKIRPNIIIHCAGSADVGKSVKYPEIDYEGNVTLTHNLLFALHSLNMDDVRFVFLSSAGVYGNPMTLPITEDMPLNPLSPYALHKVMCEEICKYFVANYGMDIKVARIFSAYGRGLRKQIFWDMHNKAIQTGRLDMFGTGNESRDYIHVDDVIQSLVLLATKESDDMFFNVANGEEVTIRQATELFANCEGVDSEKIAFNGYVREGDPINWCADISKIKSLGYVKTKNMEAGISDYCQWAKIIEG